MISEAISLGLIEASPVAQESRSIRRISEAISLGLIEADQIDAALVLQKLDFRGD